jgi:hypothetical protein
MGQLAQSTFKTPEQIKQERAQATQAMFASGQSPYERMGMAIGNILGTALGVRDPALERASSAQNIYNEVLQTNPDVTSAGFYQELSRKLAAAGLTQEAAYSMKEARNIQMQNLELGIKQTKAETDAIEAARKNVDYYKKNPEQAEFRIAQLAETLSADPTNAAALQEYTQITRAASEGSIEATQKAQKEELGTDIDRARLAKYRKDLEDAQKFGPAERWQAEKAAALTLLKNYNIDPTKPLNRQEPPLPASLLYGPVGGEITKAYERAVRPDVGTPMAVPAAAPRSNDPLGIRR